MLIPVILLFLQTQYWQGEAGVAKRNSPTKNAKLLGGHDIDITEAPYQVSIHYKGRFSGPGVLVSEAIVLTSAQILWMTYDPSYYKIRAGSSTLDHGGKLYKVEKIVVHPLYRFITYNLAVIKVSTPVTFSDTVAAIPMRKQGEEVDDGEDVQVTGWGLTETKDWPIMLQKVQVQTVNIQICEYELDPSTINSQMMCAGVPDGTKGFFEFDEGGPLVYKGELVGLVNFYDYDAITSKMIPTQAYTKVSALRSWIDETIQNITSHF